MAPMNAFKRVCPDVNKKPTRVVLSTNTGETVHRLGEALVNVRGRFTIQREDYLPSVCGGWMEY